MFVASRQKEIPFYRGFGRHGERGFGALTQDTVRTAIPILRKYIVPASKRIVANVLEFVAPDTAEVVSGRKAFKTAARSVGRETLRKQLGSWSRRRTASSIIRTKSAK